MSFRLFPRFKLNLTGKSKLGLLDLVSDDLVPAILCKMLQYCFDKLGELEIRILRYNLKGIYGRVV